MIPGTIITKEQARFAHHGPAPRIAIEARSLHPDDSKRWMTIEDEWCFDVDGWEYRLPYGPGDVIPWRDVESRVAQGLAVESCMRRRDGVVEWRRVRNRSFDFRNGQLYWDFRIPPTPGFRMPKFKVGDKVCIDYRVVYVIGWAPGTDDDPEPWVFYRRTGCPDAHARESAFTLIEEGPEKAVLEKEVLGLAHEIETAAKQEQERADFEANLAAWRRAHPFRHWWQERVAPRLRWRRFGHRPGLRFLAIDVLHLLGWTAYRLADQLEGDDR